MTKLIDHRYGKARVRVLKILRAGPVHTLKDLTVKVLLRGDFASSYTSGDNSKVVATDTIKNTVNVLAHQHLGDEIEPFAITLGQHFVTRYPQVETAEIEVAEKKWDRLSIEGEPHPHAFAAGSNAQCFTRAVCTSAAVHLASGIRDLLILKSTGSGFEKYPRDEFTTLPETADRILATTFSATWHFSRLLDTHAAANETILAAMLKIFAQNYSPSAQTTLFQMGDAALAACPQIDRLEMAMPNKHCLLLNLAPFGLPNANETFVPTDEPHGQIEATVVRDE
ncbi:MAG: factor-independent urate hydroxylase [Chthoniobacterales bacterium]